MSEDESLPPEPDDRWSRAHRFRSVTGRVVWVRPDDLAERHPAIEHLTPREAVDLLHAWGDGALGRGGLETLHAATFGPPADLDPERRWTTIRLDLERAFRSGHLVAHLERPPAPAPGTIPAEPKRPGRPVPGHPASSRTWVEIALVDEDGRAIADEPVVVVTPEGRRHHASTNERGLVRLEGVAAGVCDVTFPRIDAREWRRR